MSVLARFSQEEGKGTKKEEVDMVGRAEWEKLCSKDSGARARTPATRSATAMPRRSAATKRSRRAEISWQGPKCHTGGYSEKTWRNSVDRFSKTYDRTIQDFEPFDSLKKLDELPAPPPPHSSTKVRRRHRGKRTP